MKERLERDCNKAALPGDSSRTNNEKSTTQERELEAGRQRTHLQDIQVRLLPKQLHVDQCYSQEGTQSRTSSSMHELLAIAEEKQVADPGILWPKESPE
jgi:hypothetical protein